MELTNFFKKKKVELTEEQRKWNKMWELWADEHVDSPYAELMTYQSEINNGGHSQYFTNVSNTNDLQKEMLSLETILPLQFKGTLGVKPQIISGDFRRLFQTETPVTFCG